MGKEVNRYELQEEKRRLICTWLCMPWLSGSILAFKPVFCQQSK